MAVCLSIVLSGKNFIIWPYTQIFQRNSFTPAMYIDTINSCHFLPVLVILTLAGGHKVNGRWNLWASFSFILFNWSGWNSVWCWSHSDWTLRCCFLMRCSESAEISGVLPMASKIPKTGKRWPLPFHSTFKVSGKQHLLASFSGTLFNQSG